jgi:all-trans-retinol 13,14-reductase
MHSFKRFDEIFDTGAHYVGALDPQEPFRVLLEYLGVFDEKLFSRLDAQAFDVFHFPKGRVNFAQGYENVVSELKAIFPGEHAAIEKYFEWVRTISNCFPTYRYNDTPDMSFPPQALDMSLKQIVEGLTANDGLKGVFYAYCNLHGVYPEDVAFGFHAIVTDSLIAGGSYGLNGGGDALTAKFVEQIKAHGGEVLTHHKVTSLEVGDDRTIKIVRTANGGEFCGDWVISSLHPKSTFRLLSTQEVFPPVFKERLKNMKESNGIFGLYAVCNQRPVAAPDQNHYFFRSDNPYDMFKATNPGERPPVVFMSSPKREWPQGEKNFPVSLHAPSPFEWYTPWLEDRYGRRSPAYKDFKNSIANSIYAAVEQHQPGFAENIRHAASSTPLTHLHFNGSEEGSSYGIYHSIQNTGARALGPRTKVLNLLLTGQNCLFPGLMGAATSALRTCGHVVGIKAVLQELKSRGVKR